MQQKKRYKPQQILAYLTSEIGYKNKLSISVQKLEDFLARNATMSLRLLRSGDKVISLVE
jgi:hypothetical protein